MSKYALVFGASGVSGWSMVNELLHDYPRPGVWGGVVALTNRPLSLELSHWPADDSRLSIVSGIDLLKGSPEDVEAALGSSAPGLDKITHVFYLAYKASTDTARQDTENTEMLKRAVVAADRLCPLLEHFVLQTGAKHYGCHLLRNRPAHLVPPFAETAPPLEGDAADGLFYLPQLAFLAAYARGKRWGWIETRPDIVVGFVPAENFYSLASSLGFFLSLYRAIHGAGAACPFPGTAASWAALSNDSSAEMIARQTIFVALADAYRGVQGAAFNVADERAPRSWATRWPDVCACFGLQGVRAAPPQDDDPVEVRAYIRAHLREWQAVERAHGLRRGLADHARMVPGFEHFLLSQFDQDRQYDMGKMYDGAGFAEERDTTQAWGRVFDHMRAARILPQFESGSKSASSII